jgi:pimeloyl-ACP methyl ester carboxylesterase
MRSLLLLLPLVGLASCSPTKPAPLAPSAASARSASPSISLALAPCTLPGIPRPAKCGTAVVLEDRALGRGRTVSLKVVVVPATQAPAAPDPFVFVVGGPGQAATDAVPAALEYPKINASHDFVFVDQRGMGHDSPLRCKVIEGTDVGRLPSGELPEAKLRACLASMDANPAMYTTTIAADDLDEVLGTLGYAQANVMGTSYGTFAVQTFAHAHPARVRTLILDGVVPPDFDFVVGFAPSSQVALEQTLAECAADAACHARYPDPQRALDRAFARLDAHPETLMAEGPEGKTYPVLVDRRAFALALRNPLYTASQRGYALRMIHDVADGKLERLGSSLLDTAFTIGDELSVGGYLSVACTESLAGVTMADVEKASAGTFLGTARAAPVVSACRFWPIGKVPAWIHEPVSGDVAALLFGGTQDPATPLAGLRKAMAKLKNAQAVVVPGAGHDVEGACLDGIVAAFLEHPLAKVDTSCVKPISAHFDPAPVKLSTAQLDRCTGRFALAPGQTLTIARVGDALVGRLSGAPKVDLDAASPTSFRVPELGVSVDFEMGPDGRAAQLVLHEQGGDTVAPRGP